MRDSIIKIFTVFLPFLIVGCAESLVQNDQIATDTNKWEFAAFEKVDSLNPILHPSAKLKFECPITKRPANWEERNVLNPSAVVREDTVYLFYRAQDLNGTSRIGLAKSADGLHFKKSPVPVFYPSNDSMKIYEWN